MCREAARAWIKPSLTMVRALCSSLEPAVTRALEVTAITSSPLAATLASGLAAQVDNFLSWGARQNVPMYLGEFGAYRACFEHDKGGLAWVSDMLDILRERSLPFTYHADHEDAFRI